MHLHGISAKCVLYFTPHEGSLCLDFLKLELWLIVSLCFYIGAISAEPSPAAVAESVPETPAVTESGKSPVSAGWEEICFLHTPITLLLILYSTHFL